MSLEASALGQLLAEPRSTERHRFSWRDLAAVQAAVVRRPVKADRAGDACPVWRPSCSGNDNDMSFITRQFKSIRRRWKLDFERESFRAVIRDDLFTHLMEASCAEHSMALDPAPEELDFFRRLEGERRRRDVDARIVGDILEKISCVSPETGFSRDPLGQSSELPMRYLFVSTEAPEFDDLKDDVDGTFSASLRVEYLTPAELLERRTAKLSALKRSILSLRNLLASFRSFSAAVSEALPSPGRLITATCHLTRGPSETRTTALSVVRGELLAGV